MLQVNYFLFLCYAFTIKTPANCLPKRFLRKNVEIGDKAIFLYEQSQKRNVSPNLKISKAWKKPVSKKIARTERFTLEDNIKINK